MKRNIQLSLVMPVWDIQTRRAENQHRLARRPLTHTIRARRHGQSQHHFRQHFYGSSSTTVGIFSFLSLVHLFFSSSSLCKDSATDFFIHQTLCNPTLTGHQQWSARASETRLLESASELQITTRTTKVHSATDQESTLSLA